MQQPAFPPASAGVMAKRLPELSPCDRRRQGSQLRAIISILILETGGSRVKILERVPGDRKPVAFVTHAIVTVTRGNGTPWRTPAVRDELTRAQRHQSR